MTNLVSAHLSLGANPIYMFGSEEQKQKFLAPLAEGSKMGAFELTEPSAGSDAGGTRTTAVLDGDEWVVNGSKIFITNAKEAETYINFQGVQFQLADMGRKRICSRS